MATGGYDAREERRRRRSVFRLEQERNLEEQGVLLSDEDTPRERQEPAPSAPFEHEVLQLDENQDFTLELTESEEEHEGCDPEPKQSDVFKERAKQLEEEKMLFEERLRELERREQLTVQRGRELEERRKAFEKHMQEYEERERQAMKKKLQDEMLEKSTKILNELEEDLRKKQMIALEKEKEIEEKEKYMQLAEERWKAQELEIERKFKER